MAVHEDKWQIAAQERAYAILSDHFMEMFMRPILVRCVGAWVLWLHERVSSTHQSFHYFKAPLSSHFFFFFAFVVFLEKR